MKDFTSLIAEAVAEKNINKAMMVVLQSISFTGKFTVDYSGSSDSGNIDDISIEDPLVTKSFLENTDAPPDVVALLNAEAGATYWGLLDRWSEHLTNNIGYDWYNNEGGGGTIIAEPMSGLIKVDGYYNETTQTPVEEDLSMDPEDETFTHDYGGESTLTGNADG